MALEVPGIVYVRRGSDWAEGVSTHFKRLGRYLRRRLAVKLYPTMHSHGGSTWKYYGPSTEARSG